jgi:hypothetical protein
MQQTGRAVGIQTFGQRIGSFRHGQADRSWIA